MAVAVRNATDSTTQSGVSRLATASVVGALYVLASIAVITQAIPQLWSLGVSSWMPESLSFVNAAGLIVVVVFAVGVLAALGVAMVGANPPRGLRAGIFTVLVWLALTLLLTVWIGRIAGAITGVPIIVHGVMGLTAAGLLYWGWSRFIRPTTPAKLEAFENQGWFSTERYKPNQGLRVRRGTMLGLLVLLGAGVWVLQAHSSLFVPKPPAPPNWVVEIPYTGIRIPILPDVEITVPVILAALAFWFSFRIVNWPVFADFLIATEAEVNKISWPTRKSVVQDTIVVLVTVFLLTVFLFVVDLLWGTGLKWIGVLHLPDQPAATRQADQVDW